MDQLKGKSKEKKTYISNVKNNILALIIWSLLYIEDSESYLAKTKKKNIKVSYAFVKCLNRLSLFLKK